MSVRVCVCLCDVATKSRLQRLDFVSRVVRRMRRGSRVRSVDEEGAWEERESSEEEVKSDRREEEEEVIGVGGCVLRYCFVARSSSLLAICV